MSMAATAETRSAGRSPHSPPSRLGDRVFGGLTLAMAFSVFVLIVLVGWQLWSGSHLAVRQFGFGFLTSSDWDPVNDQYGALPFIYGTLVSSLIAPGHRRAAERGHGHLSHGAGARLAAAAASSRSSRCWRPSRA